MPDLRIKFSKHGALRYIGHLDVMRYFQKCIRRADLDIAYTGGFSPHQIMSFASPLGVGLESDGEYMDIRMNSYSSSREVMDALNAASVPEIRVLFVGELPENAGNAMASVYAADYEVRLRGDRIPASWRHAYETWDPAYFQGEITRFLEQPEILLEKEGKKGTRLVDIKEGILEFRPLEEPGFFLRLNASSAGNVKPVQVFSLLMPFSAGEALPENGLLVTRKEMYTNTAAEEEPIRLIPLWEVCR
ncbi:MAG: TIGR03936 family radical SAM-associated protein [Lachnospiraceae bacterium]|nr:TIGR03936 family radical SAM-associated protein [Lachnospiraceae bacterium]